MMDSGCPGGGGGGVMVGRMLSCSIVMEHMPKPQRKLRWTLHFSVWVVVGSVFFVSLSLENLEQQNSSVFRVV